jgi:hypothetical protein
MKAHLYQIGRYATRELMRNRRNPSVNLSCISDPNSASSDILVNLPKYARAS